MPSERDTRATPLEAIGGERRRRTAAGRAPTYLIAGATGRDRPPAGARPCSPTASEVRALVRDPERGRAILGPDVELFEADLDRRARPRARRWRASTLAYFLVHMLGERPRLRRARARRRRALRARPRRARASAGWSTSAASAPTSAASPHLDSRHAHRRGPARARPAADLLPRRDGRRPRQRVLRAAALDRRAGSRPLPEPGLAALARPSRSGSATWSPTSATRRGSPPRRAARSRSAGPT